MQTQSLINKPCTIEHQTIGTFECIPLEINNRDTIVKIIDPLDSFLAVLHNIRGIEVKLTTSLCHFIEISAMQKLLRKKAAFESAQTAYHEAIKGAIPAGAHIDYEIATGRISRNLIVQPYHDILFNPERIHVRAPSGSNRHIDIHQITRVNGQPFSLEPQP